METLTRDGVRLAYTLAGQGDPPLVFVHGWCCDQTYFAPQVEHFQARHRVLAVDLRGFGASDAPEQDYSMEGYADDVVWLCQQLGLARPVVVGHSLGGIVTVVLAARHPDFARGIVLLDSAIPPPAAMRATLPPALDAVADADDRGPVRAYIAGGMFRPGTDPAFAARITEAMLAARRHVLVSAMRHRIGCDAVAAARACRVPVLYVRADDPDPQAAIAPFREHSPQVHYGQTVGSGHFIQLEVPDQVNAMLERFVELV